MQSRFGKVIGNSFRHELPPKGPLNMAFFVPAEILTLYGLVLMVCGALAYQESGMMKSAMSALYVGNGGAVVSFLLAAGVRNTKLKKGDAGYKIMMVCIHLAVVFPLFLGGAVGWRLWLAWNNPEKAYLKPFFSVIVGMSFITSAFIISAKPKKGESPAVNKKQEDTAANDATSSGSASGTAVPSESITKRKPRKASAM